MEAHSLNLTKTSTSEPEMDEATGFKGDSITFNYNNVYGKVIAVEDVIHGEHIPKYYLKITVDNY